MNQKVFQINRGGKFLTVKSCNDALGVCRSIFGLPRQTTYQRIDNKTTIINGDIEVKEIDISLACV